MDTHGANSESLITQSLSYPEERRLRNHKTMIASSTREVGMERMRRKARLEHRYSIAQWLHVLRCLETILAKIIS